VIAFAVVAAAAFIVLRVYGERVMASRAADTPLSAARELVQSDNTIVGQLGGIREVAAVEMRPLSADGDTVALVAEVVGRSGGGMLHAEVVRDGARWRVVRASFLAPDGSWLPLEAGLPGVDPAR